MEREIGDYVYSHLPSAELGRGTYGTVYIGHHKDDEKKQVAIKVVDLRQLSGANREYLNSEIKIHQTVDHPNIVKFLDVVEDVDHTHMYLVMEYCPGGDLSQRIRSKGPLAEDQARRVIIQLLSAIRWLHEKGILHRDLKPQNLLIANTSGPMIIKVADFGLAKLLQGQNHLASTVCGSPLYMAPEVMHGEAYDSKAELWSLGVITYECLVGRPPFNAESRQGLTRGIKDMARNLRFPSSMSNELQKFLRSLLQYDPKQRHLPKSWMEAAFSASLEQIAENQQSMTKSRKSSESNMSIVSGSDVAGAGASSFPSSQPQRIPGAQSPRVGHAQHMGSAGASRLSHQSPGYSTSRPGTANSSNADYPAIPRTDSQASMASITSDTSRRSSLIGAANASDSYGRHGGSYRQRYPPFRTSHISSQSKSSGGALGSVEDDWETVPGRHDIVADMILGGEGHVGSPYGSPPKQSPPGMVSQGVASGSGSGSGTGSNTASAMMQRGGGASNDPVTDWMRFGRDFFRMMLAPITRNLSTGSTPPSIQTAMADERFVMDVLEICISGCDVLQRWADFKLRSANAFPPGGSASPHQLSPASSPVDSSTGGGNPLHNIDQATTATADALVLYLKALDFLFSGLDEIRRATKGAQLTKKAVRGIQEIRDRYNDTQSKAAELRQAMEHASASVKEYHAALSAESLIYEGVRVFCTRGAQYESVNNLVNARSRYEDAWYLLRILEGIFRTSASSEMAHADLVYINQLREEVRNRLKHINSVDAQSFALMSKSPTSLSMDQQSA
eukprot:Clim_evm1s18 gene=Clim_evmTU1s18